MFSKKETNPCKCFFGRINCKVKEFLVLKYGLIILTFKRKGISLQFIVTVELTWGSKCSTNKDFKLQGFFLFDSNS